MTDLNGNPKNAREETRIRDLMDLIPAQGGSVLDLGARDGYLALQLTDRYRRVVALDLNLPAVADPRVECVVGDATALDYRDDEFDTVVCAEVLEHVPESSLKRACREIVRVARQAIVIGVPYRQDLRYGRTLCAVCGRHNPPWGHVNRFDERRLLELFHDVAHVRFSFVGANQDATNPISAGLMRFAGYPYGTYTQSEPCVYCGAALQAPRARSFVEKLATKAAYSLERVQQALTPTRANWIHARFDKPALRKAGNRP